jgi:hypothetical protein
MQPALIYACLAMAKLIRSSEVELGANGRVHALGLRDAAQAHLRESWDVRWVDLGLAEAAMVLALFETSAHPQHDGASVEAALILLDKIIEALQLTALDESDPDTLDHSTGVPTVLNPRPPPKQCDCAATTAPSDGSNTWSFQLAWDPLWTEADVKSEETRRLCWSALILVANHTAERAAEQREPLNLFLVDPSNVCYPSFGFVARPQELPCSCLTHLTCPGLCPVNSSVYSSLENIIIAENTSSRRTRGKIAYGHSTAAACFFGTAPCGFGTSASRLKSAPESLAPHMWRPVWWRKHLTRTSAT